MMTFIWVTRILCNNTQTFALTKLVFNGALQQITVFFEYNLVKLSGQNPLNARFSRYFFCIITQTVPKGLIMSQPTHLIMIFDCHIKPNKSTRRSLKWFNMQLLDDLKVSSFKGANYKQCNSFEVASFPAIPRKNTTSLHFSNLWETRTRIKNVAQSVSQEEL